MSEWIRRTLGLRGSWSWACRQMRAGYLIRPAHATGSVRYRISRDGHERVEECFDAPNGRQLGWNNAILFLSDFEAVDWVRVNRPPMPAIAKEEPDQ